MPSQDFTSPTPTAPTARLDLTSASVRSALLGSPHGLYQTGPGQCFADAEPNGAMNWPVTSNCFADS